MSRDTRSIKCVSLTVISSTPKMLAIIILHKSQISRNKAYQLEHLRSGPIHSRPETQSGQLEVS